MTLDEAIKHEEETANMCQWGSGDIKQVQQHKQLAEWLRELKRFKKNGGWIPIKTRELTEEEKKHFEEQLEMEVNEIICSPLPEDGQEVLITIYDRVYLDTFCNDWYGSSFENTDIEDVKAWMSLPDPYKEDDDGMD